MAGAAAARKENSLRIWRSPYSNFQRDETLNAAKVYTPAALRGIAAAGFNAIWIHALLHEVAPASVFPEFGRRSATHLRSLRTVIRRGREAGVKVYLYMQPPRGLPSDHPFWRRHPETKGAEYSYWGEAVTAMCTSEPKVLDWLQRAARDLSRALPGLGGAILITASEYVGHCYSKHNYVRQVRVECTDETALKCPRCRPRHPREIVLEIIRAIHHGFAAAGRGAEVIAWNWSWNMYEPDPSAGIIRGLPKGVRLLVDFERGGEKTILGKQRFMDEYSLSYVGPSARFMGSYRVARRRGMPVLAKLQIGTTHELAVVPNLPLIGNLYDKARAVRRLGLDGFMGCWNFGNMLTANTAAFARFFTADPLPPKRRALTAFAADYLPRSDAAGVVKAWDVFRQAMDFFPFSMAILYAGPMNYALQYPIIGAPLTGRPMGPSWLPSERGDKLSSSFGGFTIAEIIEAFRRLNARWAEGVALLENALSDCTAATAGEELRTVQFIGHCYRSTWNIYRAWKLRENWSPAHRPALRAIQRDELDHLPRVLPLLADRRMGYHSECQCYMVTTAGVKRKIRELRQELAKGERRTKGG